MLCVSVGYTIFSVHYDLTYVEYTFVIVKLQLINIHTYSGSINLAGNVTINELPLFCSFLCAQSRSTTG